MGGIELKKATETHRPVMVREVLEFLRPHPKGIYVDATLGGGGHAERILEASYPTGKLIGFDVDPEAISFAKVMLSRFNERVTFVNENFTEIDRVLEEMGIGEVDGIIADLGMSSFQIELSGRGFSFLKDEPLDMRMNPRVQTTARDLVNELKDIEIAGILKKYGEESWAGRIAKEIVKRREKKPIETSAELAQIVEYAIPRRFHPTGIHPATRTFQALRIAVNRELQNLEIFLRKAVEVLKKGARMVVITFHSLEDRIVKSVFRELERGCICPRGVPECRCGKKSLLKILTPKPITPGLDEVRINKRARSAKLRASERMG